MNLRFHLSVVLVEPVVLANHIRLVADEFLVEGC